MTGSGSRRRETAIGAALFAVAFAVYLLSPVRSYFDPRYTMLASEVLVTNGSPDLAPFVSFSAPKRGRGAPSRAEGVAAELEAGEEERVEDVSPGRPSPGSYQLREVDSRVLLWYPPGTSLLSAPLVGVLRLLGWSSLDQRGQFQLGLEGSLHAVSASFVAALAAFVVFRLARAELPLGSSVVVALATAFGSSLWSSASRAMWSHGWAAVLVGAAWLELLRWERGESRRGAWLGALLAAGFWVRPTGALAAAAATIFVARRHRSALGALLAAGALGLALFVGWSEWLWGDWLPPYYRLDRLLDPSGAGAALAGLLFSPTRGLLVFTPILILVALVLLRRGVPAGRGALCALGCALLGAHLALLSLWPAWWGGRSYGPRLLADVVPLLAWFAALAWRVSGAEPDGRGRRRTVVALAAFLLLLGAISHGAGALSKKVTGRIKNAAVRTDRLWEWRRTPLVLLARELISAPIADASDRGETSPPGALR